MSKVTVIKANEFDISDIMRCLVKWLDSTNIPYPPTTKALMQWVASVVSQEASFIAISDNKVIGTAALSYFNFPWNHEFILLNNDWFFVESGYRQYGTAQKLIDAMKAFSSEIGLPIYTSIINGIDTDKKDRFFQMNGLKYLGGNFIFNMG
jgi:hypothetical protein